MKLSIAIPTYECHGNGVSFLDHQFDIFSKQTFKDFQIVISDQSKDTHIEDFCTQNKYKLNIKYLKNNIINGNFSSNANNAILNCDGEIIKIIFQDDFLYNNKSLEYTIKEFSDDINWMVSSSIHTFDNGNSFCEEFNPSYHGEIHLGNNSISCPSVLSIRNRGDKIFFDERLIWLVDVDYYKRLYEIFGPPKILNKITVVIRVGDSQISRNISDEIKNNEYYIVSEKFKK